MNTIVKEAADELLRQVLDVAGDLPEEYRVKAKEIAKGVELIASEVIAGALPLDRARKSVHDLRLATESLLAQAGLDALKMRKEVLARGMQVLLKVAVAAMA